MPASAYAISVRKDRETLVNAVLGASSSRFVFRIGVVALAAACAAAPAAVVPPSMPLAPRYEVVDTLGSTDVVVDIAVDPAGLRPALVYFDSTRADLLEPSQVPVRLARYDRFARTISTMGFVNGRTGNNRELRLAIDENSTAHVLAIEVVTLELSGGVA